MSLVEWDSGHLPLSSVSCWGRKLSWMFSVSPLSTPPPPTHPRSIWPEGTFILSYWEFWLLASHSHSFLQRIALGLEEATLLERLSTPWVRTRSMIDSHWVQNASSFASTWDSLWHSCCRAPGGMRLKPLFSWNQSSLSSFPGPTVLSLLLYMFCLSAAPQ